MAPALLVIAKEPLPGRVKTRLTPPCTPRQAAALAQAALDDTLRTALGARAGRRVLVLDGRPGAWVPDAFEVIAQRGQGLAERMAAAFAEVDGPAFLVGMDTPQLTPALLDQGLAAVAAGEAAFGPAVDGGYWGIGLPAPDARVFHGIPMSEVTTGAAQRARMAMLGLRTRVLPALRDVDAIADARAAAALAPGGLFAAALDAMDGKGIAA